MIAHRITVLALLVWCTLSSPLVGAPEDRERDGPPRDAILGREVEPVFDIKPGKTVDISEPGVFTESDTLYRLTRDITAPVSRRVFKRVKDCIIDLGGHTITYHTSDYKPVKTAYANGILLSGCSGVIIRNGFVMQDPTSEKHERCHVIAMRGGGRVEIYRTVTVLYGGHPASGIDGTYGCDGVQVHDNYVVGQAKTNTTGICFSSVRGKQRVYRNVIFDTHRGIAQWGDGADGFEVFENLIQPKRSLGQKSPYGVRIAGAKNARIHHNQVVSSDARGIGAFGDCPGTQIYENLIDVQYTNKARSGYYAENRPYGIQLRGTGKTGGIKIFRNRVTVGNTVKQAENARCEGIRIEPNDISVGPPEKGARVYENVVTVFNVNPASICAGLKIGPAEDVIVRDNVFRSDGVGVLSRDLVNCRIVGNTFIKPLGARPDWKAGLEGAAVVEEKKAAAPPAKPAGLKALIHFNAVELNWQANEDDNVHGYIVYRNGKPVEPKSRWGGTFFIDNDIRKGQTYRYAISAVDTTGNEGPRSDAVVVRIPDR